MKTAEIQKFYSSLRNAVINSRKLIQVDENAKSGTIGLDFMTGKYWHEHLHVINFLSDDETLELLKKEVPESGRGYVQIFVKEIGDSFKTYGIEFIPYHIMHKQWGLGFSNINPNDFIYFMCLFENDCTKFRGAFKK